MAAEEGDDHVQVVRRSRSICPTPSAIRDV